MKIIIEDEIFFTKEADLINQKIKRINREMKNVNSHEKWFIYEGLRQNLLNKKFIYYKNNITIWKKNSIR